MNNTFDFHRFGLLFRKHTAENFRYYLMSLVVLCGLLVLVFSFGSYQVGRSGFIPEKAQYAIFIFFFLLGGTVFTSTIYADLSEKKRAIAALVLPASSFEKYLVGWIYTAILFPVFFLICFYAIDCFFVFGLNHQEKSEVLNVFSADQGYCTVFWIYALFNGIVLWGAVFFEKLHFIKTAFCFFLSAFVIHFLNVIFIRSIIPDHGIISSIPFNGISIISNDHVFQLGPERFEQNLYIGAIVTALTLLFWISAYYRIKEKEV